MLPAEQFLANISHELRTPLHGIVGYSQLLSQSKLDPIQLSYINNINKCCLHLVELVNDILDFSKLTTDKMPLNLECFSLQDIFNEVQSIMQEKLHEKKQKIRFINQVLDSIIADRQKIIQVLINLISNSNKFTPMNGRIIVSVQSTLPNILQFSIEDDGIGISKENQKNLFQPFTQVKQNKNGVGLGLAICKKLVENMNGSIWIESDEGNGSIFSFTIEHYPLENYEKNIEQDILVLENKLVLVADSNIDSRLNIAEILFDSKISPVICSSSQETIKMVKRHSFFAVLIDENMVDYSINRLIKEIQDYNPDIPIIGIGTTNCQINISKPVNRLKILDALCKIAKKLNIDSFQLNSSSSRLDKEPESNKILIAEDVPYNLEMIVKMLNTVGYTNIDTAIDGEDTIQKLQSENYKILLLDLKMPKKDGLEVLEFMKSKEMKTKVAVITASTLGSDKEKCKEYGVKYFLLKPFNSSHLKNIVDRLYSS